METTGIIHCENCGHRFKSRRSKTGYSCEVWGNDDFACDVPLDGYCHKAKLVKTLPINNIYVFGTRAEAERVLNIIKEKALLFGNVYYAEFIELIGHTASPDDHKYGWVEHVVGEAKVILVSSGYIINLPRPVAML